MNNDLKEKNPLVSVLLPVYNTENYLKKCIESVLNQNYENIELIIIDDGSTDNSGKICDFYEIKDKRVRVLHKSNEGKSAALNIAIGMANGEYITFIDSDDWVDKNIYSELINALIKYDADIVNCGFYHEYKNKSNEFKSSSLKIYDGNTLIENCYKDGYVNYAIWSKLYKKEIFNSILFPSNCQYEDAYIYFLVLEKIKKCIVLPKALYHYRQRKGSITYNYFNEKQLELINVHKKNKKYIEEKYPILKSFINKDLLLAYKQILQSIVLSNLKYDELSFNVYLEAKKYIRKNLKFIFFSKLFSFKEKMEFILININDKTYGIILKLYKTKKLKEFYV